MDNNISISNIEYEILVRNQQNHYKDLKISFNLHTPYDRKQHVYRGYTLCLYYNSVDINNLIYCNSDFNYTENNYTTVTTTHTKYIDYSKLFLTERIEHLNNIPIIIEITGICNELRHSEILNLSIDVTNVFNINSENYINIQKSEDNYGYIVTNNTDKRLQIRYERFFGDSFTTNLLGIPADCSDYKSTVQFYYCNPSESIHIKLEADNVSIYSYGRQIHVYSYEDNGDTQERIPLILYYKDLQYKYHTIENSQYINATINLDRIYTYPDYTDVHGISDLNLKTPEVCVLNTVGLDKNDYIPLYNYNEITLELIATNYETGFVSNDYIDITTDNYFGLNSFTFHLPYTYKNGNERYYVGGTVKLKCKKSTILVDGTLPLTFFITEVCFKNPVPTLNLNNLGTYYEVYFTDRKAIGKELIEKRTITENGSYNIYLQEPAFPYYNYNYNYTIDSIISKAVLTILNDNLAYFSIDNAPYVRLSSLEKPYPIGTTVNIKVNKEGYEPYEIDYTLNEDTEMNIVLSPINTLDNIEVILDGNYDETQTLIARIYSNLNTNGMQITVPFDGQEHILEFNKNNSNLPKYTVKITNQVNYKKIKVLPYPEIINLNIQSTKELNPIKRKLKGVLNFNPNTNIIIDEKYNNFDILPTGEIEIPYLFDNEQKYIKIFTDINFKPTLPEISTNEEIIGNNILKYFNTLSASGYVNECEIYPLLISIHLQELLDRKYGNLTKEQINDLNKLKQCLECSSCYTTNISDIKYKE